MGYREAQPGRFGHVLSTHRNDEGELATVEQVRAGEHEGDRVLCFYDEDSPVVAPMLLDDGTRAWLLTQLADDQ